MRPTGLLLLAACLWAAPLRVQPAPILAPPGAWVEPVAIPAPDPDAAKKPYQALLVTAQSRFVEEPEHYFELATRIQTAEGLSAAGTITLPWQPDRSELIVHKVHILRDGATIDLLADGQSFTLLRRENNLESAMLTGVLTAVLQAEGLAVGDVMSVAFTIREKKGAIALRGEPMFSLFGDFEARHVRYRQTWPEGATMKWRATEAIGKPKLTRTRWGNELVLDLKDAKAPDVPAGVPARYQMPALLELSEYRDWAEISRLIAPS